MWPEQSSTVTFDNAGGGEAAGGGGHCPRVIAVAKFDLDLRTLIEIGVSTHFRNTAIRGMVPPS